MRKPRDAKSSMKEEREKKMLPAFCGCGILGLFSISSQQSRLFSLAKMSSRLDWQLEKSKLVKICNIEERRKLYKSKDFVPVESIERWAKYAAENKAIEQRKPTLDDIQEYKKIKITRNLNETLAAKVSIWQGDITKLEVDAIVNAANSRLIAGGGVDGAIHRAAGPLLQEECNTLGGCPTGEAKMTCGYNLPAKYVIHTVGPQDGSEAKLRSCYEKCFVIQTENQLTSIAFPCISTGIYGFPNRLAAHIALQTARSVLEKSKHLHRVVFCTFMPIDIEIYETLMQIYFPVHERHFNDGASLTE